MIAVVAAMTIHPLGAAAWQVSEDNSRSEAPASLQVVTDLSGADLPYDGGTEVYLTWSRMPFDRSEVEYVVERAESSQGPYTEVLRFASNTSYRSKVEGPWWAWSKVSPEESPHFVTLPTPVRDSLEVPLAAWPGGATLPPSLAQAVTYNESQRVVRTSASLSSEQMAELLALSDDPRYRSAMHRLARDARSHEAGGLLGAPFTGRAYYYRVRPVRGDEVGPPSESVAVAARENWFKLPLLHNLLWSAVLCAMVVVFLEIAKRRELFLRRIPGLGAVDEAIGRATEMGRPIFYTTGMLDMDKIPTIASTIILGEVAKKTAAYDVELKVPHRWSVTMAVCREVTRNAYIELGRPDAYHDEINYYITEEQFSYAAAVNGQMLRERPGAVFYMGYFYAESLLMAEAGASTGAIQIAGTDAEHQLPFFFTTCDYTLIGEELYAASAYLSRKPELVGTLRGQDLGKLLLMVVIFGGTLLATAGSVFGFSVSGFLDFLR